MYYKKYRAEIFCLSFSFDFGKQHDTVWIPHEYLRGTWELDAFLITAIKRKLKTKYKIYAHYLIS